VSIFDMTPESLLPPENPMELILEQLSALLPNEVECTGPFRMFVSMLVPENEAWLCGGGKTYKIRVSDDAAGEHA